MWRCRRLVVPLEYRDDLPKPEELEREREKWQAQEAEAKAAGDTLRFRDAHAMVERMTRSLTRVRHLPPGNVYSYPVHLLRS